MAYNHVIPFEAVRALRVHLFVLLEIGKIIKLCSHAINSSSGVVPEHWLGGSRTLVPTESLGVRRRERRRVVCVRGGGG